MPLLEVHDLVSGYGETIIVRHVNLRLEPGRLTALVGANGAGKTTLLLTILGQLKPHRGAVVFRDRDITRLPTHARARLGLALVPEGRQLFANMTVLENLEMGAASTPRRRPAAETLARVYDLFPRLKERSRQRAGTLSGGELQMLAVARGLMAEPALILFDELTLGLSPVLSLSLFETLERLKAAGQTILLVEQNVRLALAVSDYAYVLTEGRITMEGEARSVAENPEIRRNFLGI